MKPTFRTSLPLLVALAQPAWAVTTDELAARVAEMQKATQAQDARLGKLEGQLQNQGLLNLLNQVEALKAEVARLRGSQEEMTYQQGVADKRVKDLLADMDDRVKELESRPVVSPPPANAVRLQPAQALSTPIVSPPVAAASGPVAGNTSAPKEGENQSYEGAQALVKAGRYKEAVLAFQAFVKAYPDSGLVPNAHYWTGFSYVGMSDFESAAVSYQFLIQTYPNSPKTPDALLSLARAQVQMNRSADAVATLESLIGRFPYSRATDAAKKLLATLK